MDYETTLRCLGYALDFIQIIAVPVLLLALTGRLVAFPEIWETYENWSAAGEEVE